MLNKTIRFFLENKLVAVLLFLLFVGWGFVVSPFSWNIGILPSDPVPVDAIPDLGENQQIVFTEWAGQSPQDVEDQITYPLTTQLLTVPGVKTVRSTSMIGLSSIYVIFEEDVEFYWSRSRILEKLNALPAGTCPPTCSLHWVRMPPLSDRCSGTRWKVEIRMGIRPVAGILKNCGLFRII